MEYVKEKKSNNTLLYLMGITIVVLIIVTGYLYFSMVNKETDLNKKLTDTNTSLYNCSNIYKKDVNYLLNVGNRMINHLNICYISTQCELDINACKVPNDINKYINTCLYQDTNLTDLYKIFYS